MPGTAKRRITALPDLTREDFSKERTGEAPIGRFPRIFSVITDGSFYRSGNLCSGMRRLCRTRRFGRNTGHYGSIPPYVLGSYPARAGAVGDHVPIMTVYLKMRLGKHRHGGAVRE